MSDHTEFRAVQSFNQPLIIENLEQNLKDWISWSMLKIGGWVNVSPANPSTKFGTSVAELHKDTTTYSVGYQYQSQRKDWVWESEVNYISPTGGSHNPLPAKIYQNNVLQSGGYSINYPLGQVTFTTARPSSAIITAQYSYRSVQVYTSDEQNLDFEVTAPTQSYSDQWNLNITSGEYATSSAKRMQLPAVVIEAVPDGSSSPFELGTLVAKNKQDVLIHVLAEDRFTRNNLADIFRLQKGKVIVLYDPFKVYLANKFPLDEKGMVVNSPTQYPEMVNDASLVFRHAEFTNISITNIETKSSTLFWAVIRLTLEVIY